MTAVSCLFMGSDANFDSNLFPQTHHCSCDCAGQEAGMVLCL